MKDMFLGLILIAFLIFGYFVVVRASKYIIRVRKNRYDESVTKKKTRNSSGCMECPCTDSLRSSCRIRSGKV